MRKPILPLAFAALFLGTITLKALAQTAMQAPLRATSGPHVAVPEPGVFPDQWINGVDCGTEPVVQVHAYNDDLYILRQSKCLDFEAPFIYLIFGSDQALLLDTGSSASLPLQSTIDTIIQDWLVRNNQATIELIVTHSHPHADHTATDFQFAGQPNVTMTPLNGTALHNYWGIANWPTDIVHADLGGRILDVIPSPGHQKNSITFYDRRTQLLLTGDTVYPGHIFVFTPQHWFDYQDTLQRLVDFASQNPIEWVVGCHIEFSDQAFAPYAWSTQVHPTEHVLQFPPSILIEMRDTALGMGSTPQCQILSEWVIHPVFQCNITWNG